MSPLHSASSAEKIDSMSTLVLTLIGSSDWSHNSGLIQKANKESKVRVENFVMIFAHVITSKLNIQVLQSGGQWFTCNERYGGNTLNC